MAVQTATSSHPVRVALQTWSVLAEHRYWPAAQVAATHWPPLHTGVAGVPLQSVEVEQPQTPDAARQTGVVPAQVVTSSHPVRVALQIC